MQHNNTLVPCWPKYHTLTSENNTKMVWNKVWLALGEGVPGCPEPSRGPPPAARPRRSPPRTGRTRGRTGRAPLSLPDFICFLCENISNRGSYAKAKTGHHHRGVRVQRQARDALRGGGPLGSEFDTRRGFCCWRIGDARQPNGSGLS